MIDDIEVIEPVPHGDLCLRFTDEAEATAALTDYTGSIDIIGVIYKPTGVMLETDEGEVPEVAAIPGWHVNTRGPMLEDLLQYAVHPANPVRIWA
jgi:hypothetical protein